MSELLCLQQTLNDYVFNLSIYFAMSICQMWLLVMEHYFLVMLFFGNLTTTHVWIKSYIFTKLSQTIYLINIYNLVCQYDRSDCRLSKVIWFKYVLLGIFKYYYIFFFYKNFTDWVSRQRLLRIKFCIIFNQ